MNISDEAVEAAQQAVIDAMVKFGSDGYIDGYEEIARAALEAAAAHLMAQAWDAGLSAGHVDRRLNANPYRSAGAGE